MTTILFELGCEELPPKNLKILQDALKDGIQTRLDEAAIRYDSIKPFAAPRRLAVLIDNIANKQPDRTEQKRGPALKAAYDKDGNPTKAALGFAKGLGVDVSELGQLETDKGAYLVYEQAITGANTADLLPDIIQHSLDNLPIAKRMHSGDKRDEFVRPVQWVVLMQNNKVIDATIQGYQTGNKTRGHRFHAPDFVEIATASDYETLLESFKVVADFDKRQQQIISQVDELSREVNAQAIVPQDLLDEVTALVDLPVALRASFDERFLQVPQEALIKTMQADQKYFCLTDKKGKLLPYFVFISNIESKDPTQVIAGNEKVVRPRLADAEFFFLQDQKQPLFTLTENLKTRVFQDKLGTIWDKSERIAKLAAFIAQNLPQELRPDIEQTTRAAILSKCDLASTLVGEFPELQGVAGTYYARLNGEPEAVAAAIEEQYLPRFSGDKLPQTAIGTCLALADRVDTLVGIFGIDQAPTGSKDPFSLRRAAIGVLRILIEKKLPLNLVALVEIALKNYSSTLDNLAKTFTEVMDFMQSRYRAMYTEQGISVDTIQAVQAINPHMPLDFDERIRAVQAFRALPEATKLSDANKRVANILAKADSVATNIETQLLTEPAELALANAVAKAQADTQPLLAMQNYTTVLSQLASLQQPLDDFFGNVMVNSDDVALKNNRLALLNQVRGLFLTVADVGELQG